MTIDTPHKPRVLSGIKPTNKLTLGNYLGAMKNWIAYQETHDTLYCIVDMHALTVPQDPTSFRQASFDNVAAYIAAGVDPKRNTIFIQSHVPEHAEMGWLLTCSTPLGWLKRMTQFKDKAGKKQDSVMTGLFTYPILMAGDILLYDATHVPVGDDQKQHVELTRDLATSINSRFDPEGKNPIFTIPEPVIPKRAARVKSLRDGSKKMSKSDASEMATIFLSDSNDDIAVKIRKAKTDPEPLPSEAAGLEDRLEAANLVEIYGVLQDQTTEHVLADWGGQPFSAFKPALADAIITEIGPIRDEINRLLTDDRAMIEQTLRDGRDAASQYARKTLCRFQDALGLYGLDK